MTPICFGGGSYLINVILFIYAYCGPTRFPYQIMFTSFNRNRTVTYRITLGTLPDHPGSPPGFSWIRVAQSFVFCVVFCRSMSFCLFSFDQLWYCLSFFYLQLLITSDYPSGTFWPWYCLSFRTSDYLARIFKLFLQPFLSV